MTTIRKAAEMALFALERSRLFVTTRERIKAPEGVAWYDAHIDALRAALEEQAKQDQTRDNLERYTQEIRTVLSGAAKREWQGLTAEDHEAFCIRSNLHPVIAQTLAEYIEAALKEKNT
jgi:hypothetical protein